MANPRLAISIGDLGGIGFEIALSCHYEIKNICSPLYFVSKATAIKCAELLGKKLPDDFECVEVEDNFELTIGKNSAEAGMASFKSFMSALKYTNELKAEALVTLPISKEAWKMAGLKFVGHTGVLRDFFGVEAIMALGCEQMMVALLTDHLPLKEVAGHVRRDKIFEFLKLLKSSTNIQKAVVLGLNPHAGDGGAIGSEEVEITNAIKAANEYFGAEIFDGPCVPDVIFNPYNRDKYNWFVAMYHDQGLSPLKALYFEEGINVSLGLPIIRTSVDHGTAFDIAYKSTNPSTKSYLNALKYAIKQVKEVR